MTSRTTSLAQRLATMSMVIAATVVVWGGSAATARPTGGLGVAAAERHLALSTADIGSTAGPLNHIWIGNELSCQVAHAGDALNEFYPPTIVPADCGTFVAVGGALYAPDFVQHGGTATSLGTYTPFTVVSQTGGAGSSTPNSAVTIANVGTTGLRIEQRDTYLTGEEGYQTDIKITNTGSAAVNLVLYRAGDCYLGGSDVGYGLTETFGTAKAVGCAVNQNNSPPGRIEEWLPLTGGNNFTEASFASVWAQIAAKTSFPDSCACSTQVDNGAGISWSLTVPPGDFRIVSQQTYLSPTGRRPLVTTKTADAPATPSGGSNGYTITITNPNPNSVPIGSISDQLPAGFTYTPGSTTGATTANPSPGPPLTWTGPFTTPASGSISVHFNVHVSTTVGDFFNNAMGEAQAGYTVRPSGDTAKITVQPPPNGTLCVVKFSDANGDRVKNAGEPFLPGWRFTVTQGSTPIGTLISGTGPEQGASCHEVPVGTYTVTEVVQDGWDPTVPTSGVATATVTSNAKTIVTFGNRKRCCLTITYLGGKPDNFATGDGATAEPTNPRLPLHATPELYFDSTKVNRLFTHRFTLPRGNCITKATLQVRLKRLGELDENDTLSIHFPGSTAGWFRYISPTRGGFGWGTLTWDLSALPLQGGSTVNLLSALDSTRGLEFGLQDDTSVDYVKLTVTYCECKPPGAAAAHTTATGEHVRLQTIARVPATHQPTATHADPCCLTFSYVGGKPDGFSVADGATAEPTNPFLPVTAASALYFDGTVKDRAFGYRFMLGSGNCIKSARLKIRLRKIGGGALNDTISLKIPGGAHWGHQLTPGPGWGLHSWNLAGGLPLGPGTSGGSTSNLLAGLNAFRRLELGIQDDTSVDYVTLIVRYCQC